MSLDSLIEENKPLAPFTTLGIGGPARWFIEATREDEIAEAAAWARERGLKLFVLGGGSNLVVSDGGFNGLVLHVGLRGIATGVTSTGISAENLRVAAGEDWDGFVQRSVEENCAGIECLAGIPGTVGGTPVQNVGAYGQEVASTIVQVRAFDLREQAWVEFTAAECGFAYRRSRFNTVDRGRYVVTRVDYRLTPGGAPTLRYADVQRALGTRRAAEPCRGCGSGAADSAKQGNAAGGGGSGLPQRGELLQESDCEEGASGAHRGEEREGTAALSRRGGAEDEPMVKIPAAWLIEQAGFAQGICAGARRHFVAAHAGADQSRRGDGRRDSSRWRRRSRLGCRRGLGLNSRGSRCWWDSELRLQRCSADGGYGNLRMRV